MVTRAGARARKLLLRARRASARRLPPPDYRLDHPDPDGGAEQADGHPPDPAVVAGDGEDRRHEAAQGEAEPERSHFLRKAAMARLKSGVLRASALTCAPSAMPSSNGSPSSW